MPTRISRLAAAVSALLLAGALLPTAPAQAAGTQMSPSQVRSWAAGQYQTLLAAARQPGKAAILEESNFGKPVSAYRWAFGAVNADGTAQVTWMSGASTVRYGLSCLAVEDPTACQVKKPGSRWQAVTLARAARQGRITRELTDAQLLAGLPATGTYTLKGSTLTFDYRKGQYRYEGLLQFQRTVATLQWTRTRPTQLAAVPLAFVKTVRVSAAGDIQPPA